MATINANALIDQDDVKEIIETDLSDGDLAAFINAAYAMTIQIASDLGDCGGATTLAEIQKYITAHLVTLREPMVRSESVSEVRVEYLRQTGANLEGGLSGTPYGQTALDLDCSGKLAEMGLKRASFTVWSHADVDNDVEVYE